MQSNAQGTVATPSSRRRALRDWAQLAGLSACAFGKPFLDLLSGEVLVGWGLTAREVVALALVVMVLPPTLMLIAELGAGVLNARLRRVLHELFVAGLFGLFALQLLRDAGLPELLVVAGAAAVAVAAALAYRRAQPFRSFVTVLALALPVLLATYLVGPAATLVTPGEPARTAAFEAAVPVVLVIFDELPGVSLVDERGNVDRTRFPNFAALADDATWFRNASAVHDFTRQALPAIVSGRLTRAGTLAAAADHPETVFSTLAPAYRLNVHEYVTALCPEKLCARRRRTSFRGRLRTLLGRTARIYRESVTPGTMKRPPHPFALFPPVDPRGDVEVFAGSLRDGDRPALNFLHTHSPHNPWLLLPSGRAYNGGDPNFLLAVRDDQPWARTLIRQRYLLQLGFTDRAVGRILARLKEIGVYDRALVVVAADHGMALHGAPGRVATRANVAEILSVPLFVKAPGQRRGRVDDRLARVTDIAPTIADYAGAPPLRGAGGVSLRAPVAGEPEELVLVRLDGSRVPITAPEFLRRRDDLARRWGAMGDGRGDGAFYAIGPHRELFGRREHDLRRGAPVDVTAAIATCAQLRAVDLRRDPLPTFIDASLSGPGAAAVEAVAITLNGRVGATVGIVRAAGHHRLQAVVPETYLRQGRNEVELFALEPDGSARPLASTCPG